MAFTRFKKLILGQGETVNSFHVTQIQANIEQVFKIFGTAPFFRGVFVDVTLVSGQDNTINHGLGNEVQGWAVVNKNANADIWQSTTANLFPAQQILLRSSANVSAKIYFY